MGKDFQDKRNEGRTEEWNNWNTRERTRHKSEEKVRTQD